MHGLRVNLRPFRAVEEARAGCPARGFVACALFRILVATVATAPASPAPWAPVDVTHVGLRRKPSWCDRQLRRPVRLCGRAASVRPCVEYEQLLHCLGGGSRSHLPRRAPVLLFIQTEAF